MSVTNQLRKYYISRLIFFIKFHSPFEAERLLKVSCSEPFKLLNNLQRCRKQCVDISRSFVHAYLVNCCGLLLLCCRTLEDQAFIQEPECTPPPPKHLHTHRYICRHIAIAHFFQLTNKVLTLLALITACTGVHFELKY